MHENEFVTLLVAGKLMMERKSLDGGHPAHKTQVQTYLRPCGVKLGSLLNFGEAWMENGITRTAHGQLYILLSASAPL